MSVKVAGKKNKVEQRPQLYSAMEELQVMVSVVKKIEEQKSVEQQFCMFEAMFGGCEGVIKVSESLPPLCSVCLTLCWLLRLESGLGRRSSSVSCVWQ